MWQPSSPCGCVEVDMSDRDGPGILATVCLHCHRSIRLFNLSVGVAFETAGKPQDTRFSTQCPHCSRRGVYPSDLCTEVNALAGT